MVDILVDMIKRDVEDAMQMQNVTLDSMHLVLRQALEKLILYDVNKKDIQEYYTKEKEIEEKIRTRITEIEDARKPLGISGEKIADEKISEYLGEKAKNDQGIYDIIKKL